MVSPGDHFSKVPKCFRTRKATAKFQTGPMITEMFFHLFLQGTGLYTSLFLDTDQLKMVLRLFANPKRFLGAFEKRASSDLSLANYGFLVTTQ